jgi:thiol-disulfide isomerase/thioredoxin
MSTVLRKLSGVAAIAFGMSAATAMAQNLDGRWDAVTTQGGVSIPFRLDISGEGDHLVGMLYNGGGDTETTTGASLKDGKLVLNFEHYLTVIEADVKGQELDGRIIVSRRGRNAVEDGANPAPKPNAGSPFHAVRYAAPAQVDLANVPSIDGQWEIPHESNKGEKSWRLIVKQSGADIETTILRVDGDTGGASGRWQNGKFVASHFDGARPGLIVLTPQADGTLQVDLNAGQRTGVLTAYRPEVARAKGLPEPSNYQTHTTVRDPNEVFAWSFPDTHGKVTSNDDAKFKGKVVLAIVTGTWCPNCHDEAKYLVELYGKYHDRGLEIVALDFEEPDQQSSLKRVNAFIRQYHVPYTYVIAGAPEDMWDKIPQAVNLNTWPATFFVGRDGKVKATHAGFAGPASGEFNAQLKAEFTSTIERLLGDNGGQKTTE